MCHRQGLWLFLVLMVLYLHGILTALLRVAAQVLSSYLMVDKAEAQELEGTHTLFRLLCGIL